MSASPSTAASGAGPQRLTSLEIEQARAHLQQTRDAVLGALTGLSEAQWTFQIAPNSWSIAEIAEHVVFVQERVLTLLRDVLPAGPAAPADRNLELVDAIIIDRFPNRLTKFPAPEAIHPKGDCAQADVRARVLANTRSLTDCLESMPNLRRHVLDSPPLKAITKGEHQVMDGYQWILAASAHTERHTKQILEVKANSGFPTH